MLPRSLDWHHCYLALGTASATLALTFWIIAREFVLPLALVTMVAFSLTSLLNASVDNESDRSTEHTTSSAAFSMGPVVDDDDRV